MYLACGHRFSNFCHHLVGANLAEVFNLGVARPHLHQAIYALRLNEWHVFWQVCGPVFGGANGVWGEIGEGYRLRC